MRIQRSLGIVLYNKNYREDDKLVKIFTEAAGKRMFFVKHIGRSKLAPVIQPLTAADFLLKINDSSLSYIEDYNQVEAYRHINEDFFRLSYASYVLALADAAIPDNEPDPQLFAFLKKTLDLMEEGLDYDILTNILEIQILDRFGVRMNFHDCVFCHRTNLPFDFSHKYSGVLCPQHYHEDERRYGLDPNVIYLLNRFQTINIDELRTISVNADMKKKLRLFIDALYEDYVGIRLKSKVFIDDLAKWGDIMKNKQGL
ncbi:TPA: DNA repair protein RecO [Streptococcus equi subsp. zooepidemicus]|uniref:DNA repair protein RecO n=1 Tax=Streptococcus equi TaxID=1336 RepID=UPI0002F3A08C|nr:DNA repair protein RecO [Streptococcus equi]KIQ75453.1 DNA recombination protein RecO [Streptococcus equi subsp. zooepidemicus]MCD3374731.1 DNA repair protein RecO [Streptococcus equi subsp. zooepidemicus]MCD3409135.1 DNA repair protein RecO [Streptococcus equi subsp. zooepidemicus]MCD3424060.1 DNA repair protein RecO [Streptococcus equi subsp. zooepidemicus]MCD3443398.1 DNA repair protein RecO [Streptococcus equi subsp. zooepidemicus]